MPPTRSKSSSRAVALAARFAVDWGGPEGSEGFLRVEMLPLGGSGGGTLQLTRAVDGRRDLMDWLMPPKPARRPAAKPRPRDVTVTVFDAAGRAVARYRFAGVEPVSLALSPLDATADTLLTETLTLSFGTLSMEP